MIRKVFLATLSSQNPQWGMEQAFKGIFGDDNVRSYDFLERRKSVDVGRVNEELYRAVKEFSPDWLWLQVQNHEVIQAATLQRFRRSIPHCVMTHWMGDMRETIAPYLTSICKATHLTLASSVGQLPAFLKAGAPLAGYCPSALDWETDVQGLPHWEPPFRIPDVIFCGGYYKTMFPGSVDRKAAIAALVKAGINVGVVGHGWPQGTPVVGACTRAQQHHIYRKAKVILSINNYHNVERYYSNRMFVALVSGKPVVARKVPGIEKDFTHKEHCYIYEKPDHLVSYVKMLLANPKERERVGQNGKALAYRWHTWFNRVLHVLPKIEEIASRNGKPA